MTGYLNITFTYPNLVYDADQISDLIRSEERSREIEALKQALLLCDAAARRKQFYNGSFGRMIGSAVVRDTPGLLNYMLDQLCRATMTSLLAVASDADVYADAYVLPPWYDVIADQIVVPQVIAQDGTVRECTPMMFSEAVLVYVCICGRQRAQSTSASNNGAITAIANGITSSTYGTVQLATIHVAFNDIAHTCGLTDVVAAEQMHKVAGGVRSIIYRLLQYHWSPRSVADAIMARVSDLDQLQASVRSLIRNVDVSSDHCREFVCLCLQGDIHMCVARDLFSHAHRFITNANDYLTVVSHIARASVRLLNTTESDVLGIIIREFVEPGLQTRSDPCRAMMVLCGTKLTFWIDYVTRVLETIPARECNAMIAHLDDCDMSEFADGLLSRVFSNHESEILAWARVICSVEERPLKSRIMHLAELVRAFSEFICFPAVTQYVDYNATMWSMLNAIVDTVARMTIQLPNETVVRISRLMRALMYYSRNEEFGRLPKKAQTQLTARLEQMVANVQPVFVIPCGLYHHLFEFLPRFITDVTFMSAIRVRPDLPETELSEHMGRSVHHRAIMNALDLFNPMNVVGRTLAVTDKHVPESIAVVQHNIVLNDSLSRAGYVFPGSQSTEVRSHVAHDEPKYIVNTISSLALHAVESLLDAWMFYGAPLDGVPNRASCDHIAAELDAILDTCADALRLDGVKLPLVILCAHTRRTNRLDTADPRRIVTNDARTFIDDFTRELVRKCIAKCKLTVATIAHAMLLYCHENELQFHAQMRPEDTSLRCMLCACACTADLFDALFRDMAGIEEQHALVHIGDVFVRILRCNRDTKHFDRMIRDAFTTRNIASMIQSGDANLDHIVAAALHMVEHVDSVVTASFDPAAYMPNNARSFWLREMEEKRGHIDGTIAFMMRDEHVRDCLVRMTGRSRSRVAIRIRRL